MNALLTTLLACLIQDPQAPVAVPLPDDPAVKLDVIELKNGDELVGKITNELDGYVEIEIEDGATIGVSRAMVKQVRRKAKAAPVRAAVVRPDDSWFVLHDADGNSVGWLHTSITTQQDGSFSVNEEYEFVNGVRRYQVTNQCTADPNGHGVRCYFRERVSKPRLQRQLPIDNPLASADRVQDERIIEANADGELLVVSRLDGRGRHERQLPWSPEATFPLLARTLARQAASKIGPVSMFDPRHEELVVRRVDGTGARQVMIDGVRQRVGEVAVMAANGDAVSSREWVDADQKVVRRELAGPALVAMPSSAASARAAVGVSTIQSAIVAEADGRFGLWVPNPAWRAVEPLPPGHLALTCDVHAAEVRLSLLDHLEPGTQIETAADAVGNWFALLYPQLQIASRFHVKVRGRDAIRMQASDSRNVQQATVDVIPFDEQFLVLICRAPRTAWNELSSDYAFVRRTIELDGAALNPRRTGPLSDQRGGRMRPPVGPVPEPQPAPRIGRTDQTNNVRIPK
ncbi:MAG: hypothetical protein ACE37K_07620 [Planctomycetota bacterium]